jgi:hypothetical protein
MSAFTDMLNNLADTLEATDVADLSDDDLVAIVSGATVPTVRLVFRGPIPARVASMSDDELPAYVLRLIGQPLVPGGVA